MLQRRLTGRGEKKREGKAPHLRFLIIGWVKGAGNGRGRGGYGLVRKTAAPTSIGPSASAFAERDSEAT